MLPRVLASLLLIVTFIFAPGASQHPSEIVPTLSANQAKSRDAAIAQARTWNVEAIGQLGGEINAIAYKDNCIYVGIESYLAVYNVANPTSPTLIGHTEAMLDTVRDIEMAGHYVYIADGDGGLQIMDASIPAHPVKTGAFVPPDYIHNVDVIDEYAYVAGRNNLFIVNISDPAHPVEVGSYSMTEDLMDMTVAGHYAYLISEPGLHIVNIADLAHPVEVGFYGTPYTATHVAVIGNYAFVIWFHNISRREYEDGVRIVDISDATHPVMVGSDDMLTGMDFLNVAVAGNRVYIFGDRLYIYDVSDSEHPIRIATYDVWSRADIALTGNYAFAADWSFGLSVIDISDETQPTLLSSLDLLAKACDVAVAGKYAYVRGQVRFRDKLNVVDISDPARPVEVGTIDLEPSTGQCAVTVLGAYVYTATYDGLTIINVADPSHPTQVGFFRAGITGHPLEVADVTVVGHYAYIAGGEMGLIIVDISDPAHPSETAHSDTPGYTNGILVAGKYAYIVDNSSGLRIVDISDPSHPVEVGTCQIPGGAVLAAAISLVKNYAYVANGTSRLYIIDVTDPTHPVVIGGYDTLGYVLGVTVMGSYAYLAQWDLGLHVINISDPTRPVEAGYYDRVGGGPGEELITGVSVVEGYTYLADDADNGLFIVRFVPHRIHLPFISQN